MEKIYNIQWPIITNRTKKDIMLIMVRASKPIKFVGFKVIIMSIETFFQVRTSSFKYIN